MDVMLLSIVTEERLEHPWKVLFPIDVTLLGMTTEVMLVQSMNLLNVDNQEIAF